ncbi:MAG: T9SS type A sorting domain-containing protein [Bacteroidia bacterium]
MNKIITTLCLLFVFLLSSNAQISVSSVASNYDTIFGGTSIYYQYAWDEPLDEDYAVIFKLSKPLKAFETLWDSAMVADGALLLVTSSDPLKLLILDGCGWDLMDKGYVNDSMGLNNVSPIKISDSMDRVEWRNFGFYNEYDSTLQLPSSGSVQIKINAMNTVDITYGDFSIVRPDLCFEGFGSLRPSVTYYDTATGYNTWFIYGNPLSPSIDTLSDTAFASLPALGQKITLDFKKTNFVKRLSKINISVSPNPVANVLTIGGTKDFSGGMFQIISMDGRAIVKGKVETNRINVEMLKTGNYVLKIQDKGQVYYTRFIKSDK